MVHILHTVPERSLGDILIYLPNCRMINFNVLIYDQENKYEKTMY